MFCPKKSSTIVNISFIHQHPRGPKKSHSVNHTHHFFSALPFIWGRYLPDRLTLLFLSQSPPPRGGPQDVTGHVRLRDSAGAELGWGRRKRWLAGIDPWSKIPLSSWGEHNKKNIRVLIHRLHSQLFMSWSVGFFITRNVMGFGFSAGWSHASPGIPASQRRRDLQPRAVGCMQPRSPTEPNCSLAVGGTPQGMANRMEKMVIHHEYLGDLGSNWMWSYVI